MVQGKPAFGDRSRRFARHAGANTRGAKGVHDQDTVLYHSGRRYDELDARRVDQYDLRTSGVDRNSDRCGNFSAGALETSTRAIRERIAMLTNAVRHALPTGNVEGAPPDADDK